MKKIEMTTELFETIFFESIKNNDYKIHRLLCEQYPEMLEKIASQIEEHVKEIELPEQSEEEQKKQLDKLLKEIRERYGEEVI